MLLQSIYIVSVFLLFFFTWLSLLFYCLTILLYLSWGQHWQTEDNINIIWIIPVEIRPKEFSQVSQLLLVKHWIFPEETNKPEQNVRDGVNKESFIVRCEILI